MTEKTALNPYGLVNSENGAGFTNIDYITYCNSVIKWFLRYYVGISDFRGKGKLVEKGLPWKIEKQLVLKGKILVLEIAEEPVLAEIVGNPILSEGKIVELDFKILDDTKGEKFSIKTLVEDNKQARLVIYNVNGEEEKTIDPKKCVFFINNQDAERDLIGIETWLKALWSNLGNIFYDQKKSRKKLGLITPDDIHGSDWEKIIDGFENDYFAVNLALTETQKGANGFDPNEVRHILVSPESAEREQLWRDYLRLFAEVCKYYGVQFNIGWKEERQNLPEIGLLQAPFKAWEKERKHVREEAYKQCEKISGWLEPSWELIYGAQAETNEQKIKKLEEEIRILELEEQLTNRQPKKSPLNNENSSPEKLKTNEIIHDQKQEI